MNASKVGKWLKVNFSKHYEQQSQFLNKLTQPLFVTFLDISSDSFGILALFFHHINFKTLFYIGAKFHNFYLTNLRDIGRQS